MLVRPFALELERERARPSTASLQWQRYFSLVVFVGDKNNKGKDIVDELRLCCSRVTLTGLHGHISCKPIMISFRTFLLYYVSTSGTQSFSPPVIRPSPLVVRGAGKCYGLESKPRSRRLESRLLNMVPGEPADLTANVTDLAQRVDRLESIMSELRSNQTDLESIVCALVGRVDHLESNYTDLKRRIEHLMRRVGHLESARVKSSYLEPIIIFDIGRFAGLVKSTWNVVKRLTGGPKRW
jgi:hypothetical protein